MEADHTGGTNLPAPLTSFVGRRRALEDLERLLGTSRLVTLSGAGGSGKTRLALEVARRLGAAAPAGVRWVELAWHTDPALLPQRVAAAVGVREPTEASATRALLDVLRGGCRLLVLDNCEHLVDPCAELVEVILRACPGVSVLATSRAPLGVAGERTWLVPPLSLPEDTVGPGSAELAGSEAVELFVARARDALPAFAVTDENAPAVAEICRRLDGIPLALELAAARVRVLSPAQISRRLDNAIDLLRTTSRSALPRHRTLRATLDWSYGLLEAPERVLLQRLTVFSGGFTLDAAEAVCGGGAVAEPDVLDHVAALVDRSLLVVRERDERVRYELLETVHQYALEQWRTADDEERSGVRRRHAHHFLQLARAAHPELEGYQRFDDWLPRLTAEKDNFRAALAWSLEADPAMALRLVGHLPYFWVPQPVHWAEGTRWTEAALAGASTADGTAEATADGARAAWAAGLLAILQQDWPRACARMERAVAGAQEVDDRRLLIHGLGLLAMCLSVLGQDEAARARGLEGLDLARTVGEPWLVVVTLITGVAAVERIAGRPEAAEPALREALGIAERHDYLWGVWEAAMHLAQVALGRGAVDEALALGLTAARAATQFGADWHGARVLSVLAGVLAARGEARPAARLLGAASGWLASSGARLLPDEEAVQQELLAELASALGEEQLRASLLEGHAMGLVTALEGVTGSPTPPVATPAAPAPGGAMHLPDGGGQGSSVPTLSAAALGPLEISLRGQPVDPGAWSHARPKELLVYLLAHPEGRTREQVGVAFWPEASTARVKNSFHVLVHKLRRALGDADMVVLQGERYVLAPGLDTWFDAAVFEREMERVLRASGEPPHDPDPAARLEAALALYRGDFMAGELAGDWHLAIHDRLSRLHLDGLSALADMQLAASDPARAAATLEALLGRDELREDAYRRLMVCLARLGRREQALRHHARLVAVLQEELGAAPEPETEALAARLRDAVAV